MLLSSARRHMAGSYRESLAKGLERAVADASAPPRLSSAAPLARHAVLFAAPELEALAARLRLDGCHPEGVELARQLLTDGGGPLYGDSADDELLAAARLARRVLDHGGSVGAPPWE